MHPLKGRPNWKQDSQRPHTSTSTKENMVWIPSWYGLRIGLLPKFNGHFIVQGYICGKILMKIRSVFGDEPICGKIPYLAMLKNLQKIPGSGGGWHPKGSVLKSSTAREVWVCPCHRCRHNVTQTECSDCKRATTFVRIYLPSSYSADALGCTTKKVKSRLLPVVDLYRSNLVHGRIDCIAGSSLAQRLTSVSTSASRTRYNFQDMESCPHIL